MLSSDNRNVQNSPMESPRLTLNHYYENGDFAKDVKAAVDTASVYMDKRINDYKIENIKYKLALVLDIDDTAITHGPSFIATGGLNDLETQNKRYHEANAPAIPAVFNLYKKAIENDIDVFFLTARKPLPSNPSEDLRPYTIKNLHAIGCTQYRQLDLPQGDDIKISSIEYKTKVRKNIESNGYKIILNLGDQESDLIGGYAEKTVKIPNYLYPSTQPETFVSVSQRKYSRIIDAKTPISTNSSVSSLSLFSQSSNSSNFISISISPISSPSLSR